MIRRGHSAKSWLTMFAVLVVAAGAGCEKTTHASIDKWRGTVKGPAKLARALSDSALEADLRAHAAQALVALAKVDQVLAAVPAMKEAERVDVLGKLFPRLWNDCKLSEELQVPTEKQLFAKDALFVLRKVASGTSRDKADDYLLEWLTGYYDGRASLGQHHGELIVRTLGPKAAPKLLAAARAILGSPSEGNKIAVLGDELLRGIASAGSPEGVKFLVDLSEKNHQDDSLRKRALSALYVVYLDNTSAPLVAREALVPHVSRLQAIAASSEQPGENINVAFDIIAASGKPHCIAPLSSLAKHREAPRRWRAVQQGLKCAGADGILPLSEALPTGIPYEQGILEKYFWDKIVEIGPEAAGPARLLLSSSSWVARVTGVEVLARLGTSNDVSALRNLGKDSTKLRGWWGKESKKARQSEPTLGSLALSAAVRLEKKD
ncbi:MAG: hypothetical protein HY698_16000 [Deltaproteobacteria bacterium]|nr:hypothetical protein [Deltaproteobacteria bacterium]